MRWHSLTINRLGVRAVELRDSLERAVPRRRHPERATNGAEQRAYSIVYNTDAEGAEEDAELLVKALRGIEVAPMPDQIPEST